MAADRTQRRLGRGLEALLGGGATEKKRQAEPRIPLQQLPIAEITPNPLQPRRDFKPEELAELRESLGTSGLLQPITVRPNPSGSGYQLVAGERRWRAAQQLGWDTISAVVREADDHTLLALALVENLQRSDLNPLEEAEGYQRLSREFGLSQQRVAELTGKSRSTVANLMRLLDLPTRVQEMVRTGELTAGQVRPLLSLGSEAEIVTLAEEVRSRRLPARAVEQRASGPQRRKARAKRATARDPELKRIEDRLRQFLQTDVGVSVRRGGGGELHIRFYSEDDLSRLVERMGASRDY